MYPGPTLNAFGPHIMLGISPGAPSSCLDILDPSLCHNYQVARAVVLGASVFTSYLCYLKSRHLLLSVVKNTAQSVTLGTGACGSLQGCAPFRIIWLLEAIIHLCLLASSCLAGQMLLLPLHHSRNP